MSHLLLLPAPPRPLSRPILSALYRPTLTSALTTLSSLDTPSRLIVAVACPLKASNAKQIHWQYAQSLLAGLYVLIATVSAEQGIATDVGASEPGSVDARVILVHHKRGHVYEKNLEGGYYEDSPTAVVDLAGFATKMYPWETIFHPSSEEGYELLKAFLVLAEGSQKISQHQMQALDCGTGISIPSERADALDQAIEGYSSVALGGTFDHLHPGHKLLLHATALLLSFNSSDSKSKELIVGISADELLVNKKFADQVQPWETRARSVISFLSTILDLSTSTSPDLKTQKVNSELNGEELHVLMRNGTINVRCTHLHDPFGPTITEAGIHALAVSGETRGGGAMCNTKRSERGWPSLVVYEVDVLIASEEQTPTESFEAKISSTAIRKERAEKHAAATQ